MKATSPCLGGERGVGGEKLEVRASAVEAVLRGDLVLQHETIRGIEGGGEGRRHAVVHRRRVHVQTVIRRGGSLDHRGRAWFTGIVGEGLGDVRACVCVKCQLR